MCKEFVYHEPAVPHILGKDLRRTGFYGFRQICVIVLDGKSGTIKLINWSACSNIDHECVGIGKRKPSNFQFMEECKSLVVKTSLRSVKTRQMHGTYL